MRGRLKSNRLRLKISTFEGINCKTDSNILPYRYSPLSYNFTFEGGALTSKLGIQTATLSRITSNNAIHVLPDLPEGLKVKNLHLYRRYDFTAGARDDRIIVYASDGNYYETSVFSITPFTQIANMTGSGEDCSCCYRYNGSDVFLLSSENGLFYIYNGSTATVVQNAPKITSMCVHYERIYATIAGEGNSVWFSDDFNPTNWTVSTNGAGFINFDDEGGAVTRLLSFLDYVYIFREHGIERLTAYAEQADYSVSKVFVSSGRILQKTIAACGDRIMFLAEDGIYYFSGYSVHRVAEELPKFDNLDKKIARGCYLNGKYYLACRLYYGDNKKVYSENLLQHLNNSVVIYDIESGKFNLIRGFDVNCMLSVKVAHESSVLIGFNCGYNGKVGQIGNRGTLFDGLFEQYWSMKPNDLGYPEKRKIIKEVYLTSLYPCSIGVTLDGNTVEYQLSGGGKPQKTIINKACSSFGFYIKNNLASSNITSPVVVLDLV